MKISITRCVDTFYRHLHILSLNTNTSCCKYIPPVNISLSSSLECLLSTSEFTHDRKYNHSLIKTVDIEFTRYAKSHYVGEVNN